MQNVLISILFLSILNLNAVGLQVVPAEPPLAELKKQAEVAAIVLACKPNAAGTGLEVSEVLKGQEAYDAAKDELAKLIPPSDPKALSTDDYRELVFIGPPRDRGAFKQSHSVSLWPQFEEVIGGEKVRFLAHEFAEVKRVIRGADRSATGPKSKSE